MFCTKCGNQLPDNAASCDSCGTPVGSPPGTDWQPVVQQQQIEPSRTSGLAIASLVLGILGMCGITAIAGLITGIMSLTQISRSQGRLKGNGLAIAGIAISSFMMVVTVLLLPAILFPVFAKAKEQARRASCQANMKELALAWRMYVDDNYDTVPPVTGAAGYTPGGIGKLLSPYKKNNGILICPSDDNSSGLSYYVKGAIGAGPQIVGRPWRESDFNWPADQMLMYERGSFHWGGTELFQSPGGPFNPDAAGAKINCSFMDGHVRSVRLPVTASNTGEPNFYNRDGNSGADAPPNAADPRIYNDSLTTGSP